VRISPLGHLNHEVENFFARLPDRFLSGNDPAGIDVDDIRIRRAECEFVDSSPRAQWGFLWCSEPPW